MPPMCYDETHPDFNPEDEKWRYECLGEMPEEEFPGQWEEEPTLDEVNGDNNDTMVEEVGDVDNGPNFDDFDIDGNGGIDMNEAATYATKNGIPIGEAAEVHDYMDSNPEDGEISRTEWETPGAQEATEDIAPTISDLDMNGDGALEWLEWKYACVCAEEGGGGPNNYLSTCGSEEFCREIFATADDNEDEIVTKEEFDTAGAECKTADDGNCEFLSVGKPTSKSFKGSLPLMFIKGKDSLGMWVRKHFKRSRRNLIALARLRAQHMKGKFIKLTDLIKLAKLRFARKPQRVPNGKARKVQSLRQKGHLGMAKELQLAAKEVHYIRKKRHDKNARRVRYLRQRGRRIQ